ncbi:MAG: cytidylate kinase family protein [Nitrospinota bacterium]
MAVLSVSRELGSGGDAVAERLARELGYTLLNHEEFSQAAERYGLLKGELEKVDERRPGFIDRFFRERQAVYLDLVQAIVYEYALRDRVVILGRGGNFLLRGVRGVLRVRFVASLESRKSRLMAEQGVAAALAEQYIAQDDQERSGYVKYLFKQPWGDPHGADLVINTSRVGEDQVVAFVKETLAHPAFAGASPAEDPTLQRKAFANGIKAELITHERLDASGISVHVAEMGKVFLRGRVNSEEEKEFAVQLVRQRAGVSEVVDELVIMPPIEGWYPV